MKTTVAPKTQLAKQRMKCRKKFLYYFPKGFRDQKYIDWEREYKLTAHIAWEVELNKDKFEQKLGSRDYMDIAMSAEDRIKDKSSFFI